MVVTPGLPSLTLHNKIDRLQPGSSRLTEASFMTQIAITRDNAARGEKAHAACRPSA